jgi:hypothetical protein
MESEKFGLNVCDNVSKRGVASITTTSNQCEDIRPPPISTIPPSKLETQPIEASNYKRLKLCKRGHREIQSAHVRGLLFEGPPIWLLAIQLVDWSRIFLSERNEALIRAEHSSTWEFARNKFKAVPEEVMMELRDVELWFASGSMGSSNSLAMFSGPMVMWLSRGGEDEVRRASRI